MQKQTRNIQHPMGFCPSVRICAHAHVYIYTVHSDRQTGRQTDRQTDRQIDRQLDRQTDGRTDRRTDRQTDKPIDRKTDRQTEGQKHTDILREIEQMHTRTETQTHV